MMRLYGLDVLGQRFLVCLFSNASLSSSRLKTDIRRIMCRETLYVFMRLQRRAKAKMATDEENKKPGTAQHRRHFEVFSNILLALLAYFAC